MVKLSLAVASLISGAILIMSNPRLTITPDIVDNAKRMLLDPRSEQRLIEEIKVSPNCAVDCSPGSIYLDSASK